MGQLSRPVTIVFVNLRSSFEHMVYLLMRHTVWYYGTAPGTDEYENPVA